MKSKKFFGVALLVIMLITMSFMSLTACNSNKVTYDAGEYGELVDLSADKPSVKCKEGYRFLGWSEPVKEGNKTVCKAQYEHIEYYLNEVKDVYVFEQGRQDGPYVISKITNLQTNNETKQVVDLRGENVNIEYFGNDSIKLDNSPIMTDYNANGCCFVAPTQPYEFDVTAKVKIEDPIYNIVANFELHFVRNRIAAENISVSAWSANGENVVSKDKPCRIDVTVTPDDTSFKECEYRILTISRDGYDLDEELIKEIAYFDHKYLEITDKAESGDLIYMQVINKRDPQVKSDIIEICVY